MTEPEKRWTRRVDHDTSKLAAEQIAQGAYAIRALVRQALIDIYPGGYTDAELHRLLAPLVVAIRLQRGLVAKQPAESSIRHRRTDLEDDGEVEEWKVNGVTVTRNTPNEMTVWRIKPGVPPTKSPPKPKRPKPGEPAPLPDDVSQALESIRAWANEYRNAGMLIPPPDWHSLRVLLNHIQGK